VHAPAGGAFGDRLFDERLTTALSTGRSGARTGGIGLTFGAHLELNAGFDLAPAAHLLDLCDHSLNLMEMAMLCRKTFARPFVLAAALTSMFAVVQCGGNSTPPPSTPSNTLTITGVAVNPTSIAPGGTAQGSVTLSASTGSTVSLSSSNAGVATVPASMNVAAGATSASFTVAGVAAGAATIAASIGSQASTITVTATRRRFWG
jgi:hypothetical protein